MTSPDITDRVLVPLRVMEGQAIDEELAALLSPVEVALLGYHEVPEQTAPSQMRQQFERQAQKALDAVIETLTDEGATVEKRLVFTHDAEQSIDRVADEVGATALLLPNPTPPVASILVPVRGEMDAERIAQFIANIRDDRPIDITVLAATREGRQKAAKACAESTIDHLRALGVPDHALSVEAVQSLTPGEAIIDAAIDHDATILHQQSPSWRSIVFGELSERVAAESLGPVLVGRTPKEVD